MSERDPAYEAWWSEQSRKGDPQRNPWLVRDAFAAGRLAGPPFVPSGACSCAGPDGPCENCIANREAYEEFLAEYQADICIGSLAMYIRKLCSAMASDKTRAEAMEFLNKHGLASGLRSPSP